MIDSGLARVARFDPWRGINTLLVDSIPAARRSARRPRRPHRPRTRRPPMDEAEHAGRASRSARNQADRPLGNPAHPQGPRRRRSRRLPVARTARTRALERALTLLHDLGALDAASDPRPRPAHAVLSRPSALRPHAARRRRMRGHRPPRRAHRRHRPGPPSLLVATPARPPPTSAATPSATPAGSRPLLLMRAWNYAITASISIPAAASASTPPPPARSAPLGTLPPHRRLQGLRSDPPRPRTEEHRQMRPRRPLQTQVARRLDRGTLRCELVHRRRGDSPAVRRRRRPLLVASEINRIGRGERGQRTSSPRPPPSRGMAARPHPRRFRRTRRRRVGCRLPARRRPPRNRLPRPAAVVQPLDPPPAEESGAAAGQSRPVRRVPLKKWDAVDQWIARVNLLAAACPDWALPSCGETERNWSSSGSATARPPTRKSGPARSLPPLKPFSPRPDRPGGKTSARTRHALNGRSVKVQYADAAEPFISAHPGAVRSRDAPCPRRRPHSPRPAHSRPQPPPRQITKDLPGFWRDHYPRIKKELSRKYPRHEWR